MVFYLNYKSLETKKAIIFYIVNEVQTFYKLTKN